MRIGLLSLGMLAVLLLAGCAPKWNAHERDLINQIKATDASYYNSLWEEDIMNRAYGACHMLEGGLPESEVLKQIPRNRNAASWVNDVQMAKVFLCPEMLRK